MDAQGGGCTPGRCVRGCILAGCPQVAVNLPGLVPREAAPDLAGLRFQFDRRYGFQQNCGDDRDQRRQARDQGVIKEAVKDDGGALKVQPRRVGSLSRVGRGEDAAAFRRPVVQCL